MRDHTFWRDVASRTLSAVFAAGIVYIFALVAGYVQRPDSRQAMALFAAALVVAVFMLMMLRWSKLMDQVFWSQPTWEEQHEFMLANRKARAQYVKRYKAQQRAQGASPGTASSA